MLAPLCSYPSPVYLLFSSNVLPIVYYSHLPIILISLVLAFLVFFSDKKKLANTALFITLLAFSSWVFLDAVFWAANRSDVIMFVWAAILLIEPIVFAGCFYTLYALIDKKDISTGKKWIILVIFLPLFLLLPTELSLKGFDLANCLAIEGPIALYYTYAIEIFFSAWIIIFAIRRYRSIKDPQTKKQIVYLTIGIVLFLLSFASGNIIGSATGNWNLAQLGLFGMPVFAIFLVYSIVRYKAFNIKLLATQALVAALVILIGAQFAFIQSETNKILNIITFLGSIIFAIFLIRNVKRESKQAKELSRLNASLTALDATKNEFLSFATHQLRSPLTSIKWGLNSLKEKYSPETTDHLLATTDDLIGTVNDLLDISKIEQGGLVMKMEEFDLHDFVGRVVEEFRMTAEKKGLRLAFTGDIVPCFVSADENKLRQVFVNLIDNAIKYTQKGDIKVVFRRIGKTAEVSVWDTGPGITPEELKDLFDKFLRGAAGKASQGGSGLGLYLAKKIIENHKGHLSAKSDGIGKGSVFTVTLPLKS